MPGLPPDWRRWTRRNWPLASLLAIAGALLLVLGVRALGDVVTLAMAPVPHHTAPAAKPAPAPAPAPASRVAPVPDSPFVVRSILSIPGPIRFGTFYWDETKGEPGPLVITVDLAARVLSVFENGHEIGTTAILKGYGDKPTPIGVFPITQKDAHHVSNLYDAPMPWMLRLTNDGVSIHGSKVARGYATNGCIGVPDGFAEKLFRLARLGDKVIITEGKQMKIGDPILAEPPKT